MTLAFVVAATAVALTLALARLVGLEYGFSAGMLAGALTSTPTLAGAQDAVSFIASIDVHEKARRQDVEEVLDPDLLNYQVTTQEIIVSDEKVVGRTLKDLDMPNACWCFATGPTRASIDLPLDSGLPLQ